MIYRFCAFLAIAGVLSMSSAASTAQTLQSHEAITETSHFDPIPVPAFTLPDALVCNDGTRVTTAQQWVAKRRPELFSLFEKTVYGITPKKFESMTFTVENVKKDARNGKALRKEVVINFNGQPDGLKARVLIYVPNNRPAGKKVPAFLGCNFRGIHTITDELDVTMTDAWVPNEPEKGRVNNKSTEASRGTSAARWPIDTVLDRGYALCSIYAGEIDPDFNDGFKNGVHALVDPDKPRNDQSWATISAWAWGLSCVLDYLQTDPDIDGTKVAVLGHSRLGKTALWAGAMDPRFAMVISNDSGCGGAALYRRNVGETLDIMTGGLRYWFCEELHKYKGRVMDLPFDMHELIALQAPRPVYVASASEDIWADPKGEFFSVLGAVPVYELFGQKPFNGVKDFPECDKSVGSVMRYHVRTGKHNITDFDWAQYLDFADKYL